MVTLTEDDREGQFVVRSIFQRRACTLLSRLSMQSWLRQRSKKSYGIVVGVLISTASGLSTSARTIVSRLSGLLMEKTTADVFLDVGSSRGRGTRAAGWFDDHVHGQGDTTMKSYTVAEGITGWAQAGRAYVELMDDYNAKVWEK